MSRSNRREPRLKLSLPISGEWLTEDGLLVRINTLSDNISYEGLALLMDANIHWRRLELRVGSQIKVVANHNRFSAIGTVCYTLNQPDGRWRVGLKLDKPLFGWLSRYNSCSQQLLRDVLPTK